MLRSTVAACNQPFAVPQILGKEMLGSFPWSTIALLNHLWYLREETILWYAKTEGLVHFITTGGGGGENLCCPLEEYPRSIMYVRQLMPAPPYFSTLQYHPTLDVFLNEMLHK